MLYCSEKQNIEMHLCVHFSRLGWKCDQYVLWQAALAAAENKGKDLDSDQAEVIGTTDGPSELIPLAEEEHVESVVDQMDTLTISVTPVVSTTSSNPDDCWGPGISGPDIDKKIRALKKKVNFIAKTHKKLFHSVICIFFFQGITHNKLDSNIYI